MFIPVGTEEYTPRQRFPVVTITLVVINSLVFLFELFLLLTGGEQALNAFIAVFGLKPAALTSGVSLFIPAIMTLFTSMFVHGSLTHVGFNMFFLLAFGDNVEDWLGRWHYLVFYLLAGLLAGLIHVALNPASQMPTVGASGAIAGVLGAYLLFFPKARVRIFFFLGPLSRNTRVSALLYISFWFVIQFFNGISSLGIQTAETTGTAYWAHIGGFMAGLALGFVFKRFVGRPEETTAALEVG